VSYDCENDQSPVLGETLGRLRGELETTIKLRTEDDHGRAFYCKRCHAEIPQTDAEALARAHEDLERQIEEAVNIRIERGVTAEVERRARELLGAGWGRDPV
jgi:hypothetical protein